MIEASIVKDSISETGARITTIQATYPRFIHAELLTHRAFSRNAASNRAVGVREVIRRVRENPALPLFWAKNQKGMTAVEELDENTVGYARGAWLDAMEAACETAEYLRHLGVHKQIANRPLEPYQHITTIITATQWRNFDALRCHPAAQQEIAELASQIWKARQLSKPRLLRVGEWHLPFESANDRDFPLGFSLETRIKLCVARCARVSLFNHEGKYDPVDDLKLYDRLVTEMPPHSSPLEHVATPLDDADEQRANFKGWESYRWRFEHEIGWDSTR